MDYAIDNELLGDTSWLNSLLAIDEHSLPQNLSDKIITTMRKHL